MKEKIVIVIFQKKLKFNNHRHTLSQKFKPQHDKLTNNSRRDMSLQYIFGGY